MSNLKSNKERLYDVIKRPIITEKSMAATTNNQYTFEVVDDATKVEIKQAVELAFPGRKVKKVRTVYMPSHSKRMGYWKRSKNWLCSKKSRYNITKK